MCPMLLFLRFLISLKSCLPHRYSWGCYLYELYHVWYVQSPHFKGFRFIDWCFPSSLFFHATKQEDLMHKFIIPYRHFSILQRRNLYFKKKLLQFVYGHAKVVENFHAFYLSSSTYNIFWRDSTRNHTFYFHYTDLEMILFPTLSNSNWWSSMVSVIITTEALEYIFYL